MKRILVAGDAMADVYINARIERLCPEGPIPVLKLSNMAEQRLGGAANVAANARAMGGDVDELYSSSWPAWPVKKTRIVVDGRTNVRLDDDTPQSPLDPEVVSIWAEPCEIVVLSDYGKGTLESLGPIVARLKREGKTVIVDPKNKRLRTYEGIDVLKPNVAELEKIIGRWASEEELEYKVKAIQRAAGIRSVVLTRGAEGMKVFNGKVTVISAYPATVVDVCGAGDTALAALAVGLAGGMELEAAAMLAARAGALAVGRFGTAVISREEAFS